MGDGGFSRHEEVPRSTVQGTTPAAAATAKISTSEHDGAPVYDAEHGDAAWANANDAAAADANAATATNDGTHGANATDGPATAVSATAAATGATNATAGPATAAVCRIWCGKPNGEPLLTVRGGQYYSFKQ